MWRLPEGYVEQAPVPFLDVEQDVEWQPDVLPYAVDLAGPAGVDTIVDLGCGFARKLLSVPDRFRRVGVDLPEVLDHVRHLGGVEWIDADLAQPLPGSVPVAGALVVCSDVLEHLADPAPLLRTFAEVAQVAAAVVISTPDRERTWGPHHLGPSPNTAHAREWAAVELVALLEDYGCVVADQRWTRSSSGSPAENTILITIGR